jgi:O-antigen/teichoic acid export membrane protein
VSLAGAALSQFAFPIAFDRAGLATDPERVRLAIRIVRQASFAMAVIALIASVASVFVAEPLTLFLSTEAYRDAARYVPWLMLGLGITQVGNLLALVPMALNQMRSYAILRVELALFAIALNVLGAWRFGTLGVACSVVLASVIYVILVLRLNGELAAKHVVAAPS